MVVLPWSAQPNHDFSPFHRVLHFLKKRFDYSSGPPLSKALMIKKEISDTLDDQTLINLLGMEFIFERLFRTHFADKRLHPHLAKLLCVSHKDKFACRFDKMDVSFAMYAKQSCGEAGFTYELQEPIFDGPIREVLFLGCGKVALCGGGSENVQEFRLISTSDDSCCEVENLLDKILKHISENYNEVLPKDLTLSGLILNKVNMWRTECHIVARFEDFDVGSFTFIFWLNMYGSESFILIFKFFRYPLKVERLFFNVA